MHPYEVFAGKRAHNFVGDELVAFGVALERQPGGFGIEHRVHQVNGHYNGLFVAGVGVVGAHHVVVYRGAYGKGGVRWQCPRRGGPGQKVGGAPAGHHFHRVGDLKLCHARRVLHIAVAARLVELVRAEACAGGRRIGLDGVAFVEIAFVIELTQKPPHAFDIAVVVGDVRVFHIHPVAHRRGERLPFAGVFHHLAAAGRVVFVHRYLLADIFFGDAERFLNAELHGKSVGVPAGFALHVEAFHRFVAAENILDRAGHHMMDAGHAVGAWRSLIKHKRRAAFAHLHTLFKQARSLPLLQHFFVDG